LDISDDQSIEVFTQKVTKQTTKLDVLANNAGYMVTGIAEDTPVEIDRQQFETNFWGTIKVINALLPIFKKQISGQIITVSCIVGLIGP
jgi:NADP-dependent 3-hydroxy acid dehydrogenase YdfG